MVIIDRVVREVLPKEVDIRDLSKRGNRKFQVDGRAPAE